MVEKIGCQALGSTLKLDLNKSIFLKKSNGNHWIMFIVGFWVIDIDGIGLMRTNLVRPESIQHFWSIWGKSQFLEWLGLRLKYSTNRRNGQFIPVSTSSLKTSCIWWFSLFLGKIDSLWYFSASLPNFLDTLNSNYSQLKIIRCILFQKIFATTPETIEDVFYVQLERYFQRMKNPRSKVSILSYEFRCLNTF